MNFGGIYVSVLLLPTLGPFHILHPRYNAVTVLELLKAYQPSQILLASYGPAELESGRWRDHNELSFFHVLPWAQSSVGVEALDTLTHLRDEAEAFRQVLGQYPKGQEALARASDLEASLSQVLSTPKTPADFASETTLQALRAYTEGYARLFGEGPATGFRLKRMQEVAGSGKLEARGQVAVLVDLLDYPFLQALLPEAQLPQANSSSEAERERSVLDRAWRLEESDDWALLLNQLQEVEGPEAMYCAAQIYLAAGQPEDALALLEQLVHTDFQYPEYLPGYALARYGQLADALGQRDKALRAYAAVLALAWVPQEAREIALAGHRTPFKLGVG